MKRLYTVSVCYRMSVETESDGQAVREATYNVPAENTYGLAVAVVSSRKVKEPEPEQPQPPIDTPA